MVTQKYLSKFKKLYFEKFGIDLSAEEATKGATDLLNLMKVLLRPESKAE